MMDILKLMYFSDVLGCIRHTSGIVGATCLFACLVILVVILVLHVDPPRELDKCVAKAKKYLARVFTVALVCLCITALIPSKDLRNIFVGTVAVGKAYENEAVKNLTDKVLTLVNQRLDALIEDTRTQEKKNDTQH